MSKGWRPAEAPSSSEQYFSCARYAVAITQNLDMTSLLNKIALITGASAGIGKALVEELVSKGLKVIGLGSDLNKLKVH